MNRQNDSVFDPSPAEKLQLVEDLWGDLAATPGDIPVHDWQIQERSGARPTSAPVRPSGLSWEEVKRRIRSRHGR